MQDCPEVSMLANNLKEPKQQAALRTLRWKACQDVCVSQCSPKVLSGQHLVSGEGLLREGDISRAVSNRPALLLGSQAVALVLRTLGVLAGLAVAVQAILVHPVAREVLRWLHLTTRPAVLQTQESANGQQSLEAESTDSCYTGSTWSLR